MGIATFAFPLGNESYRSICSYRIQRWMPHIANAFAPFLIIFIVGLILGIIFVPDYPEEVGAFRDNNPNMTPEMAKNMMLEEIENKNNRMGS